VLLAHAEPDYVWLGKLAVVPAWRSHGAGSALVAQLEAAAVAAGHRRVLLSANPDAETFYVRQGYRPILLPMGPNDLPALAEPATGAPRNGAAPTRRVFTKTL
jgi:GNAT superfamily N-acetyltransferase